MFSKGIKPATFPSLIRRSNQPRSAVACVQHNSVSKVLLKKKTGQI